MPKSVDGSLCAIVQLKFIENLADVRLDRFFANDQLFRNFTVILSLGDQGQYFPLALCETLLRDFAR